MISVVIVNKDKKGLLDNCLKSLRAQTHKSFEIIVVDNGSIDGSAGLVKSIYPQAKLICLSKNAGFSAGNNIAIKSSASEYIALLNNDMEVHPRWIEALSNAAQNNPKVAFFASKVLDYKDRNKIDSAGDIFYIFGAAKKRGNARKNGGKYNKDAEVFGACAGAALYKRSMLADIGLFDENFSPAYYEDVDLSFRAQLKGYKCLYVGQAIAYHHGHSTLGELNPEHLYLCSRNAGYVLIKNMPRRLLIKYGAIIGLYNIISFLWHTLKGNLRPFLLGKISIFKNLKYLRRERKAIQAGRVVSDEYIDSILTHYSLIKFIADGCRRIFFKKTIAA